LPDNERVIDAWSKRFQVSATSAFGLLANVGEDCAGAVQFVRQERLDAVLAAELVEVEWLTGSEVAARLRALRENETAWRSARDEGQFSLAGAQPKTALLYEAGRWGVPRGRLPTTHILKPPTPAFLGHAENEHLCLELARAVGLPAARSEVQRFDDEVAIVVQRYDRVHIAAPRSTGPRTHAGIPVVRLHQEDMCQALGVSPAFKYQNEGGPSAPQIVKLLRDHSRRAADDVRTFVDALVFNWLIAGTDAHAKNYSLLHGRGPGVRLAPLYDLASALPYPQLDQRRLKLAMKIGGRYALREVSAESFRRLGKELGLRGDEVVSRVTQLATELKVQVSRVRDQVLAQGLSHPMVEDVATALEKRALACEQVMQRATAPVRPVAKAAPVAAEQDAREFIFRGMRVVGDRLVAELATPEGARHVLDPYRPGRSSAATGDRVRLADNHGLTVLERSRDKDRGRGR
jgi:serine/threonine-protein kinase HipA